MAYINGARTPERIVAAVKANLGFLMRVTWITSPIVMGSAQRFIPMQFWEPCVHSVGAEWEKRRLCSGV